MFTFEDVRHRAAALRILRRMPPLSGAGIRIQRASGLRDRRGPVHAGAFVRERRIAFDCAPGEFPRIFAHEIAHFIWPRLGNPKRRLWESMLRRELRARVPGELGWSAQWRKAALAPHDMAGRTRRWREYCCEAFCDTAAWMWSGMARHREFTLPSTARRKRRFWFRLNLDSGHLSI
ncbi:MAG TPA: hypothetical protein VMH28_13355 [Candidatus Acidoferrales bacterium]|nr:hypothetical protein [Candidatus Acidoferrales bacterium]